MFGGAHDLGARLYACVKKGGGELRSGGWGVHDLGALKGMGGVGHMGEAGSHGVNAHGGATHECKGYDDINTAPPPPNNNNHTPGPAAGALPYSSGPPP